MMHRSWLAIALAAGCQSPPTHALFDATSDDFYALPFPNDIRRDSDGTIDVSRLPTNSLIVDTYRQAVDQLDGFGLNAALFARFDGPLDATSLPDPAGSLTAASSVYLVDIDPASPARGERIPIIAKFRPERTDTMGDNRLVVRPFPGFGLSPATTYALVITNRVRALDGEAIAASNRFEAVLAGSEHADVYQPLLDYLDEAGDDARADVVSAAVFTTQHIFDAVPALRAAIFALPAPVATTVVSPATNPTFKTFTGAYQAPNFQQGNPPYRAAPSGQIRIGSDGRAVIERMEAMRFGLTVPAGAPPAGGFPIAIYSHGTGGDYLSFVADGTAAALAQRGIAVISTDQVLHGPRNPTGDPEIDFFNFQNPSAMRDNALQGAADAWSQLRLANGLSIADGGRTITFDSNRVYFFGHSQGGLTGPGFVAFEPQVSGAVFSGTGGLLYLALLHKTAPLNIPDLLATFVRDDPMDEDNPSLAMVQMWVERADGGNYAPLMARARPLGDNGQPLAPCNVFQTEGFTDTYTPNPAIEAFAVALGSDLAMTAATKPIAGLELRGRSIKPPPFANNVDGATLALAQYNQAGGSDGHFVVFDIPAATRQAAEFLGTLAASGTATVVAPN